MLSCLIILELDEKVIGLNMYFGRGKRLRLFWSLHKIKEKLVSGGEVRILLSREASEML